MWKKKKCWTNRELNNARVKLIFHWELNHRKICSFILNNTQESEQSAEEWVKFTNNFHYWIYKEQHKLSHNWVESRFPNERTEGREENSIFTCQGFLPFPPTPLSVCVYVLLRDFQFNCESSTVKWTQLQPSDCVQIRTREERKSIKIPMNDELKRRQTFFTCSNSLFFSPADI